MFPSNFAVVVAAAVVDADDDDVDNNRQASRQRSNSTVECRTMTWMNTTDDRQHCFSVDTDEWCASSIERQA
jgi:hypothetical protein